jgi:hypothetical protein
MIGDDIQILKALQGYSYASCNYIILQTGKEHADPVSSLSDKLKVSHNITTALIFQKLDVFNINVL